jgi:hypothetical protein
MKKKGTLQEKRVRGSGPSHAYLIRLKITSIDSVKTRSEELNMNTSQYVRWLINQDIGVEV